MLTSVVAPPGQWYHVAYVARPVGNVAADGTAATEGLLYVNGRMAAAAPADVVPPPLDTKLYVGGYMLVGASQQNARHVIQHTFNPRFLTNASQRHATSSLRCRTLCLESFDIL